MAVKMQDYKDDVQQEQKLKPKLFTYPNYQDGCTVFDFEDLLPESLLVLCVKAQFGPDLPPGSDRHRVIVWRGA